ncbi:dehydrogenase [Sphingomonas sp. 1P08PE]|uniref:GHMP family kinase ATP-binding protein n=1 Tax=Sphingomonas sp. 1P08PE TaxID=554122 RepID=UPI0039A07AA1
MTVSLRKTRSRAPLRLGLAGGGTDLSPYCDLHEGAVLNVTIDRFAFATLTPRDDNRIVFVANDLDTRIEHGLEDDLSSSPLLLHRGVYERMIRDHHGGKRCALTITTSVDAPLGSGLGSSSALVVALVDAFREMLRAPLGQYDVARLAYEIERVELRLAGGRQDQYAAAFGDINFIEFLRNDRVLVNPLRLHGAIRRELESSLIVCFTGSSRESARIIEQQTGALNAGNSVAMDAMHALKATAVEMKQCLFLGDIVGMADLLNQAWRAKKATASGIATQRIDELFEFALANGALGGKVSGAGGGGFMFFLVEPDERFRLIEKLQNQGARAEPVKFHAYGCETWQP